MLKSLVSRLKCFAGVPWLDPIVTDYRVQVYLETDTGCVREVNQDFIRFVNPVEPRVLSGKGMLVLVCDGMGGARSGDLASSMTASAIESSYYGQRSENVRNCLKKAFVRANNEVFDFAESNPEHQGMGTTATALVIRQGLAYYAHVGDSRLYLVRNGQITQLTMDQSVVAEKVRQGLMTKDQARIDEERNVVTQALGTKSRVDLEFGGPVAVLLRDTFILCSDGLHDLITDQEILATVTDKPGAAACKHLINLATNRGGYDNISLILLLVSECSPDEGAIPVTRY